MNKERVSFKELSSEQLNEKLEQMRRDYFGIKLQSATAHIKDNSQFKKLRRNIACVMTLLGQKNARDNNDN